MGTECAPEEVNVPHGQRDWSNIGADKIVHGMDDMAELAARLGSLVTFNREGNVVFLDSFESGLGAWYTWGLGDGDSVETSAAWSRTGGYCALLTNDAKKPNTTRMFTSSHYLAPSKIGCEFTLAFDNHIKYLYVYIDHYDGSGQHAFNFRYDHPDKTLAIYTTTGYVTIIDPTNLVTWDGYRFHDVKLVVDLATDQYVRLIINNTEYNLEQYTAKTFTPAGGPYFDFWISVTGNETNVSHVYVDNVILTQNEP